MSPIIYILLIMFPIAICILSDYSDRKRRKRLIPSYEERRKRFNSNIATFIQTHAKSRDILPEEKIALAPYLDKSDFLYSEYLDIYQTELMNDDIYRVIGKAEYQLVHPVISRSSRKSRQGYLIGNKGGYYVIDDIEILFPYRCFELIENHEGNVIDMVLTEKYAIAVAINGTSILHLADGFTDTPDKIWFISPPSLDKTSEFKQNITDAFTIRPETKQEISYFSIGCLKYLGCLCAIIALFILLYNIDDSRSLDNCFVFISLFACPALYCCLPKRHLGIHDKSDVYCLHNAKIMNKTHDKVTVEYSGKTFEFSYPSYWFDFLPANGYSANIEVANRLKYMVKCGRLSIYDEVLSFGAPKPTIFNKIWLVLGSICLLWALLVTDNVASFVYTYSRLTNSQVQTIIIDNYATLQHAQIKMGDWLKLETKAYCDITRFPRCNQLIINPVPLETLVAQDPKVTAWLSQQHEELLNPTMPHSLLFSRLVNAISDICDTRELTAVEQSQCDSTNQYLLSIIYFFKDKVIREEYQQFHKLAFDLMNNYHEQNRTYLIELIKEHQKIDAITVNISDTALPTNNSYFKYIISKTEIQQLLKSESFKQDVLVTSVARDATNKIEKIGISTKAIWQKSANTMFSSAITSTIFTIVTVLFLLLQIIFIMIAKYKNKARINRIIDYLRYYY